jgi:pyruvate/2-oxoglutarate dehydrogenase complex dihydrolipoamide dehydrogenase (E3) component
LQIRDFIAAQLQAQGIVFHFGDSPTAVEKNNDGTFTLVTESGKEASDLIMFATGRAPNTKVFVQFINYVHLGNILYIHMLYREY